MTTTTTTTALLLPAVMSPSPKPKQPPPPSEGAAPAAAPAAQHQQHQSLLLLRQYEVALSRLLLPPSPSPPHPPKPTYYALLPPASSASARGRRHHGARLRRQTARPTTARPGKKAEDSGGTSSPPSSADEGQEQQQDDNDDDLQQGDEDGGLPGREGQIVDPVRAKAKDRQVESVLACLDRCCLILERSREKKSRGGTTSCNEEGDGRRTTRRRLTIADMGAGSGHLAIPAALRHPRHRFVAVDLSRRSLDLMKIKAARVAVAEDSEAARKQMQEERQCRRADENYEDDDEHEYDQDDSDDDSDDPEDFLASNPSLPLERTAIPNLYALCGPIERYLLLLPDDKSSNEDDDDGDNDDGNNRSNGNNDDDGGGGDGFEKKGRLRFQVGLALHLCGQSTDVAIRACIQQNAALVAAPCCVGKIQTTRRNPYVWQATQSNFSSIRYPQSTLYQQLLRPGCGGSCSRGQHLSEDSNEAADAEEDSSTSLWWNALACAADDSTGHLEEALRHGRDEPITGGVVNDDEKGERGNDNNGRPVSHPPPSDIGSSDTRHRRSCCRAAKVLVEWDRCLYLRERGYRTWLTRMVPASASPKHDIIVAVPKARTTTRSSTRLRTSSSGSDDGEGTKEDTEDASNDPFLDEDHDAVMDLERTRQYLRAALGCSGGKGQADALHGPGSPESQGEDEGSNGAWAPWEVAQVRELLVVYFALNDARTGGIPPIGNGQPSHDPQGGDKSSDVYYFPTGMGRGKRKLVHHVAGTLGLEHWSHGKKQGTGKTVAVALPGTRRRMQNGNSDTAPGRSKPTQ